MEGHGVRPEAADAAAAPDGTAVRVALWRALHVQADAPPPVFVDEVGLALAAPRADWRARPDMDPQATARARASIVGRARFVEELVLQQVAHGVDQYVILGAGLDSFAQRHAHAAPALRVFEVDRPGPQAWKRRRLAELGLGEPRWLRFVPMDFESGVPWPQALAAAGFDAALPAVVGATGVAMYLSREAVGALLRQAAALAPGSTLVLSFMLPLECIEPRERALREVAERQARTAGTPFLSFFTPQELLGLAREAGLRAVRHVGASELAQRYFAGRADALRPSSSEALLVATT